MYRRRRRAVARRAARRRCAAPPSPLKAVPVLLRLGVQEQGRAAAARRGGRLSCRRRPTCRRCTGTIPTARSRRRARASDDEPFAALAFKIMTDAFVGQLTFFRVYSGTLDAGSTVFNADQGQARAHRAPAAHARQQARGDQDHRGGQHRRRGRPARDHDGRHAVRREAPDPARAHGVPRPGHLAGDRAQDQGRPGQDGPGARHASPSRIRPSASTPTRRPARRSSRAWASCTSRSSSTA